MGKKAFVNKDNELLMKLKGSMECYTYGKSNADCIVNPRCCDPYLKVSNEALGDIQTQLVGAYNFENVAAAIAVGTYFGVPSNDIRSAIESYQPTNSRSQVIEGKNHIIMDAYNANPSSMSAAITNFRAICGEHPLPILGDMLELGDASENEHQAILSLLWESGFRKVFLVGSCFNKSNEHLEYQCFPTVDDLLRYLESHPVEGHDILVKGSHGIHLEKALPLIQ